MREQLNHHNALKWHWRQNNNKKRCEMKSTEKRSTKRNHNQSSYFYTLCTKCHFENETDQMG